VIYIVIKQNKGEQKKHKKTEAAPLIVIYKKERIKENEKTSRSRKD
jgi:hypothetical protein